MPSSSVSEAKRVYNVPMASDMYSVTIGLDPELALARNLQHLASFRHHSVGPMPMQEFTDAFLPSPTDDRHGFLSSRNAFRSVPAEAQWPPQICKPLVGVILLSFIPPASTVPTRSLRSTK